MPCALVSNMVANTPGLIHREIFEKILIPLVSAVRDEIGLLTAESLRPQEKCGGILDDDGGAPPEKEADERGDAPRPSQGE